MQGIWFENVMQHFQLRYCGVAIEGCCYMYYYQWHVPIMTTDPHNYTNLPSWGCGGSFVRYLPLRIRNIRSILGENFNARPS